MDDAFQYVQHSGGICTEADYPYTGKDGDCHQSTCGTLYDPITSFHDVQENDMRALERAVAQNPVSIAIEADAYSFQFYHKGVYKAKCGDKLDHGVLLVGYGYDDEQGMGYWKIKNSWGPSWGEDGYIRICKDCDRNHGEGQCGVLMCPSYPVTEAS